VKRTFRTRRERVDPTRMDPKQTSQRHADDRQVAQSFR
jgi:hypothetical protein